MQTISMTSKETQSFQLVSHSEMFNLLAACENEFVKSARVTLLHNKACVNTAVVRRMRRTVDKAVSPAVPVVEHQVE